MEAAGQRWLRTGDIVRMDEEGYFHFYDRSKDLIKFKGYSVFAKDVEDVLYGHPQIKAAGVVGVADPAVGQRIKAIVVLQSDARGKVSEDEVKSFCRERLADYKVPHIVEFRGELPKPGSFGCPVPQMRAAVVDPDTLRFVPPGETGELVLAGPNVMAGYWQKPEESAKAFFERDGYRWLRTGDLVRMDDEGYFYFYDRSKDLIKFKGYSVFAKDVEDVLYAHPQVKAAGVIGVADPAVGQRIKAIVVLQGEARGKVSEDEIKSYCRQSLAEYKVPHIVEFRGELPKTDVGKISRRELREESA